MLAGSPAPAAGTVPKRNGSLATDAAAASQRAGRVIEAAAHDPAASSSPALVSVFEVVTTRAGLDGLEGEWTELFDRAGRDIHVFQSFNWVWHWANHFLPDHSERTQLYIVTARRGGRLVLIVPLLRRRSAGLMRLTFLGEPVSQYGDLLIDDLSAAEKEQLIEQAWHFINAQSGADVIALRRMRADANMAGLMTRIGATVTDRQIAPYLDLGSATDYDSYAQRHSSRARKNRRRLWRRFEERAPAQAHTLSASPRAAQLADLAISLKKAWLKERGLYSSGLSNPATRRFFMAVTQSRTRPVGTAVTSLETRGEAAAIEISFDCKGRRAVHVIVYALKYERASAGQLLIEQSVRQSFEAGHKVYDLLAPGDAYKLDWADGTVDVCDHAVATSAKGRAYVLLYLKQARPRLKAAVNGVSALMRRLARKRRIENVDGDGSDNCG